uniref:Membrane spanning protein n=1 Tax=Globodera pallida TaxID=36090 RepID=A0A183BZP6_GLOPA
MTQRENPIAADVQNNTENNANAAATDLAPLAPAKDELLNNDKQHNAEDLLMAEHYAEHRNANALSNDRMISRAQFVRKVLSTVAIMLALNAVACVPLMHPVVIIFVRHNNGLDLLRSSAASLISMALTYERVRRAYPTNIILFGVLTLFMGFTTANLSDVYSLFLAFGIIFDLCLGVALIASTMKKDLTGMNSIFPNAALCLMLSNFVVLIVDQFIDVGILSVGHKLIGLMLFVVWLASEIQKVMGGRANEISPKDHICVSITVVFVIIEIFLFLLQLTVLATHLYSLFIKSLLLPEKVND